MQRAGFVFIVVALFVGAIGYISDLRRHDDRPDVPVDGLQRSSANTLSPLLGFPAQSSSPSESAGTVSGPNCFAGDSSSDTTIAGRTLIVDPGHGGEDLGTVNETFGLHESELVLSISEILTERLTESGANVCLTRTDDDYVSLMERAAIANANDGDAFISIHLNRLPDPAQDYTMTMWGDEAKDKFLAQNLLDALAVEMATPEFANGEPNPMNPEVALLEHLDSGMLRTAQMPAALVEGAFLSNTWEAQAFVSGMEDGTHWRERQIAVAVHDGLVAYFEAFE